MAAIRWVLGKIILTLDALFAPSVIQHGPEWHNKAKASLEGLSLYQFEACPFCVKVRRFLKAESISIPLFDAKKEPYRSELLNRGGKLQVPCLKIESAEGIRWLYESNDIIAFLKSRLPS
jgi:glutaredoxin